MEKTPSPVEEKELIQRLEKFKEELDKTVTRLGIKEPTVVAVSKKQPEWKIEIVAEKGFNIFGENYVQEALAKGALKKKAKEVHLIGPMQSNKVKKAIKFFDMIQAVDREKILLEIEKKARKYNVKPKALLELKISPEPTKHGLTPKEAIFIAEKISNKEIELKNTEILGIMGIASLSSHEVVQQEFRTAISTGEKIAEILKIKKPIFSLGMSNDYEIALATGSNMIRIGTKIFGERK